MNSLLLRRIFLFGSLAAALLLWFTSAEKLQSMSAYACHPMYLLMHVLGGLYFTFNGLAYSREFDNWVGFGMFGILVTNMYHVPVLHNIVTAATMLAAIGNSLYYASKDKEIGGFLVALFGGLFFLVGLLSEEISLFWMEFVAMAAVLVAQYKFTDGDD